MRQDLLGRFGFDLTGNSGMGLVFIIIIILIIIVLFQAAAQAPHYF